MRKIIAVAIWPIVYVLDFVIYLTGAQSFSESRRISRMHFTRILQRGANEVSSEMHNKHFHWFWQHS